MLNYTYNWKSAWERTIEIGGSVKKVEDVLQCCELLNIGNKSSAKGIPLMHSSVLQRSKLFVLVPKHKSADPKSPFLGILLAHGAGKLGSGTQVINQLID